jgi:hypothetical protein
LSSETKALLTRWNSPAETVIRDANHFKELLANRFVHVMTRVGHRRLQDHGGLGLVYPALTQNNAPIVAEDDREG